MARVLPAGHSVHLRPPEGARALGGRRFICLLVCLLALLLTERLPYASDSSWAFRLWARSSLVSSLVCLVVVVVVVALLLLICMLEAVAEAEEAEAE